MAEEARPLSEQEVAQFNSSLLEFLRKKDESQLETLFNLFDRNGNGVLSGDEIKTVMEQVSGHGFSNEQVQTLIAQVDANGDGVVDIREFIGVMHRFTDQLDLKVSQNMQYKGNFEDFQLRRDTLQQWFLIKAEKQYRPVSQGIRKVQSVKHNLKRKATNVMREKTPKGKCFKTKVKDIKVSRLYYGLESQQKEMIKQQLVGKQSRQSKILFSNPKLRQMCENASQKNIENLTKPKQVKNQKLLDKFLTNKFNQRIIPVLQAKKAQLNCPSTQISRPQSSIIRRPSQNRIMQNKSRSRIINIRLQSSLGLVNGIQYTGSDKSNQFDSMEDLLE